jgi:hypothetical protein
MVALLVQVGAIVGLADNLLHYPSLDWGLGIGLTLTGWAYAHFQMVRVVISEKAAVERTRDGFERDSVRLTSERDEARRQRDIAETALKVVGSFRVTATEAVPLPPPTTSRPRIEPPVIPRDAPDDAVDTEPPQSE